MLIAGIAEAADLRGVWPLVKLCLLHASVGETDELDGTLIPVSGVQARDHITLSVAIAVREGFPYVGPICENIFTAI